MAAAPEFGTAPFPAEGLAIVPVSVTHSRLDDITVALGVPKVRP